MLKLSVWVIFTKALAQKQVNDIKPRENDIEPETIDFSFNR